ncbi:hypothetical protein SPRG_17412 [Saprolegnia parasitica CBS 223.65]|uniref:MATE efflux family protein n=1 Tax=Saprolegnia parasitica (strain CBS 223.65) TaxID=695850 RepID=A0A067BFR0_SAPPC|nr:hypothetical protein SPRG_17412 [Saprolegnia parasitica CBS 223.65]KDO17189.1 hypothetical protein SPRG_17412 [Saprolegnia parasitica CBS 223.65]|eukprot:XP_012212102.1 hypothetical protein SPRG_17412 [Saprolegnia parasitica CBS 223.65]
MTMHDETKTLLPPDHLEAASTSDVFLVEPHSLRSEVASLIKLAYPMVATYLMEFLPGFLSVLLVGHLESPLTKEYVDAAALSTVFLNLSGLSIGFGLASALDTLCSQAVGAGKTNLLGGYLQCGLLVLAVTYVPMFLLNYNSGLFLVWLGQDPVVASLAGEFSRVTVFCLPLCFTYELLKKVLQAQHIAAPMAYIAITSNLLYAGVGYYLCYFTDAGFLGIAYARLVCNTSLPLLAILYIKYTRVHEQWWPQGSSWTSQWHDAVRLVGEFLQFGVPAMAMMLLEWWALEILTLMAGWMPSPVLAISVHSVAKNHMLSHLIFLGLSIATTIRLGNEIGAYEPMRAKVIVSASYVVVAATATVLGAFVLAFRLVLPAWLINDASSIRALRTTQGALYILVVYQFVDAMKVAAQGLLRGMGRQAIGAHVNAVAYCAIGLPLAALFGFLADLDVPGLWMGMTIGVSSAFVFFTVYLARTNWRRVADDAASRMDK